MVWRWTCSVFACVRIQLQARVLLQKIFRQVSHTYSTFVTKKHNLVLANAGR